MKLDDMKVWPEEAPEKKGDGFLIWTPDGGYQITRYDDNHRESKKPYFYWCGNPKKVWWVKLEQPRTQQENP